MARKSLAVVLTVGGALALAAGVALYSPRAAIVLGGVIATVCGLLLDVGPPKGWPE